MCNVANIRWLSLIVVCLFVATPRSSSAQTLSVLIDPPAGSTSVDPYAPFTWTSVPGAQAYYLYVGTTVGAKDVVDSWERLQTSYQAAALPVGQVLYARMWTKLDGIWRFVDSQFTAVAPASLIAPAAGATNVDALLPFRWTPVGGAVAYYLYVGTSVGAKDIVDSAETQQTVYQAAPLPPGQTLYARLWTKLGTSWRSVDSQFATASTASLLWPSPGATNVDSTQPVRWTPVIGAQAYYLYVGTTAGGSNIVNTGEIHQTSYTMPPLSGRQMFYIRLWTKLNGQWSSVDSQFTTAPVAILTSPVSGASSVDPAVTFTWTSVSGAQSYYLYVGTTVGGTDLVNTNEVAQTSYPAAAPLPAGQVLYARLWTKTDGTWRYVDSQFTTTSVSSLIAPAAGALSIDPTQSFGWSSTLGAQAYVLNVGTTVAAKDVIDSGETLQTTFRPGVPLPVGQTLYARLWTKAGGIWRFKDSHFSTAPVAVLTAPIAGASNADPTQPFRWSAVAGAQAYYLQVGTTPGAKDLIDAGETQQTSYTVASTWSGERQTTVGWDVPFDDPTPLGGYAVTLDDTRTDIGLPTPAKCSATGPPAWCYAAPLPPRSPGAHTIFVTAYNFVGEAASEPMAYTEPSRVVYVRLWTKVGGLWRYTDSSFTPSTLAADFMYPAFGTTNVDATRPLEWTAIPNAEAYSLTVGYRSGGFELVNEQNLPATSYLPTGLASLPPGTRVFARLGTRVQGSWRYSETTFTIASVAKLTYPKNGTTVPRSIWFSWSTVPDAQAYYLYVGRWPGAKDVIDTYELHTSFFEASALPPATTLFVRLWTKIAGTWRFVDTQFTTQP